MKEIINQINQSIDEKRIFLKEKAECLFSMITIPSSIMQQQNQVRKKDEKIPPISYILYGIAGLSAIGSITTDSKALCLGVAAISALGGYKFSKSSGVKYSSVPSPAIINITLKNEIISKVLESLKEITYEWEDFMELKQKEIQMIIATSSLKDNEKDALSSKVFIYEVIDISISEFSSLINEAVNTDEIKQILNQYKMKLLAAIDSTADKQTCKYKSLI